MTQYMLSVQATGVEYDMPPEEAQPMYDATDVFNKKLISDGYFVYGGGLERIETTTSVDARGSDVIVTDGPFVETKEYLGGFWIIEAPDLDVALKLAAEGSKACQGKVEVRPINSV